MGFFGLMLMVYMLVIGVSKIEQGMETAPLRTALLWFGIPSLIAFITGRVHDDSWGAGVIYAALTAGGLWVFYAFVSDMLPTGRVG